VTTQKSLAETAAILRTVEEIQRRAEEKLQELIRAIRAIIAEHVTDEPAAPAAVATAGQLTRAVPRPVRRARQAGRYTATFPGLPVTRV
jgi:hypothetical protein